VCQEWGLEKEFYEEYDKRLGKKPETGCSLPNKVKK
jgi:hypothetical protein